MTYLSVGHSEQPAGLWLANSQEETESANYRWSLTRDEIDQGGSANLSIHDSSRVVAHVNEQRYQNFAWGR